MTKTKFPPGWNEEKAKRVISFYDNQSEDDAILEAETGLAIQAGNRVIPIDAKTAGRLLELARAKKTTIEKLINAQLQKIVTKAA